ncbi:TIGR01457 family HAD-type hydrolase [Paenibacillus thailandensis]|uniref:Acid sugar phosphatase n=1 Tax=Paenibacillus thailandensis TaxID=393250 RepID=A0ABW5QUF0_9BACL
MINENKARMRGLLIDLDGTLYHGNIRIEGADRLVNALRAAGLPFRFVTNNSTAAPETVAARLNGMGVEALPSEVCTSAQASAEYISKEKPGASVFVVGEAGLRQAVREAGLRLTEEKPDYVLQGIDRELTYARIASAVRYIREGASYVMTNPDLLLPSEGGLLPGAGTIGAMLRAATGREPVVIGKPSPVLMNFALEQLGLRAEETWVVGDNMATDIAAGIAAGCGTALVLTGLTTKDNYERYAKEAGCEPDLVCHDLDELQSYIMAYIESMKQRKE